MPVNPFFKNNFPNGFSPESNLLEDLIIESIKMHGSDVLYMPKIPLSATDTLYGENQGSIFSQAIPIEMYIENIGAPDGPSEFFSKFGLNIADGMRFILARKMFNKYVPSLPRPMEGDLLFLPLTNKLYEIKFVEQEKDFHSLGRKTPYFFYYELQVEAFKFNNEIFVTGNSAIDTIGRQLAYTLSLLVNSVSGNFLVGEQVFQGSSLSASSASATVKSWDVPNNLLNVIHIKGSFTLGTQITGVTSGSTASVI